MVLQGLASADAAVLIGAVAWCGSNWTISLTLIIPVLVFTQPRRSTAGAMAILYFAAASWPMMPSAKAFWSLSASSPLPPIAWVAASALLATPWIILWSPNHSEAVWRCPLALLANALPPLGVIGWASPLVAAGVTFPGTHWLGISAALLLPGAAIHRQAGRPAVALASLFALGTNLIWTDPPTPLGWATVNTADDTAKRSDPIFDFEVIQSLQNQARCVKGRVLLTPESAVLRWNEATSDLWQRTVDDLKQERATMLVGTSFAIPGSPKYTNLLLAIGTDSAIFVQRNPVPIAMWRPVGPGGTALRFTGRSTLDIAGQRSAVLICYEQLLVWPMLQSVLERPTLILGIANDYWCRGTHIPTAQKACMKAWARLFGLPMLSAVNY
jgi:hypothetical protein